MTTRGDSGRSVESLHRERAAPASVGAPSPPLIPEWPARVLGICAVVGVGLLLLWTGTAFVNNSPLFPSIMGRGDRLIDDATTWAGQGLGGPAAWGSLMLLAGLGALAVLRRSEHQPVSATARWCGVVAASLLAVLELTGLASLADGFVQLVNDPTAARDIPRGLVLFQGPLAMQCLATALLSGLSGWVLWRTRGASQPAPVPDSSSAAGDLIDPDEIFRRPTGHQAL